MDALHALLKSRRAFTAALCAVSLVIFFRGQVFSGFTLLFSDRYDGFIEISILEHWLNVFKGWSNPFTTEYFYPTPNTLGYNDGYFLYGLVYSVARVLGCDPFLSSELVNIAVRCLGFFGFCALLRLIFGIPPKWAAFGALLFTISNNAYLHSGHQQLLAVSLVPFPAMALWKMAQRIKIGDVAGSIVYGIAVSVSYASLLMTSFYISWFIYYFMLFFIVAWLLIYPFREKANLILAIRRHAIVFVAVGPILALSIYPFIALYFPKAEESGMHNIESVADLSSSVIDLVNVGEHNLLWGKIIDRFYQSVAPASAIFSEHTTGFPLLLLTVFVLAAIWLIRHRRQHRLAVAVLITSLVTCLLLLRVGDVQFFRVVFYWVPGGKALRAISRYQIFLAAPFVALVTLYLSRHAEKWPKFLTALVCLVLVLEQINHHPWSGIDRPKWVHYFARVPAPPEDCRAFFVIRPDPATGYLGGPMESIYLHSVDAMLIAELHHLPTVNGFSTFVPPGFKLYYPEWSIEYLRFVEAYAKAKGVTSLCGLDLVTMAWTSPAETQRMFDRI